jgi:hypothetical protein
MASLPPSPFTALPASSAETLVVAPSPQAPVAAISGPFDSDAPVALRSDEAVASQSSQAPGATADIDEHRFVLDVEAFMEAIEPPPLFLQGLHELAGH